MVVCENGTNHVIILDWGKYAFNINYFQVAKDAFGVGDLWNQCLTKIVAAGLDLSLFHIIGFSLGAHIAGFAMGCNDLNKTLRITGLDPANPTLYPAQCYFNPSNQTGVEAVHTNMGQFGTCCSMGEQEWFVNSGHWQSSNCPNIDIPNALKDAFISAFNLAIGPGFNDALSYCNNRSY
ncbi:lipase member H-like [Nylanderia fulva]|uniref:lipase member H-like n=1 Tax=Nylanderia fulva TaxID=613905 RepID=UPI0010FBAC2D|nr:lipase member H-like [Nylanderia fulva]